MANVSTSTSESFAALFEESLARQEMRQGEVITAEVVLIDHNFVVVNAGLKSESYVPLEEFLSDQGELEVKVGDFVQVAIEMLEDGYGATRLSRDRAKRIAYEKEQRELRKHEKEDMQRRNEAIRNQFGGTGTAGQQNQHQHPE